jgi:hypothetical protein
MWLLVYKEYLILSPKQSHSESINACITSRLQLLHSSHINTLFIKSHQVTITPPKTCQHHTNSHKAASNAANKDNFSTAFTRATKTTPVAVINQQLISKVH